MGELSTITSNSDDCVSMKIYANNSKYDYLFIQSQHVTSKDPKNKNTLEKKPILKDLSCGDCNLNKTVPALRLDGILVHYFVQELRISPKYRNSFIKMVTSLPNNTHNKVTLSLQPTNKEIIDYSWNNRTTNLAWERVELDHALSWLSTLGGAFSALGDYFSNCALIAGKISFHQLKLALRLGDPTVAARCKLYFSLSLIQRGYLKSARNIICEEYSLAKNAIVVDSRLIKMCLGIWAKLKYEWSKKIYKL